MNKKIDIFLTENYNNAASSLIYNADVSVKNILKAFFLERTHALFCQLFHAIIQQSQNSGITEHYTMDSKIIQILINGIIDTGEYTLEGIAYYTRIPLDVIFDAACGGYNNQLSITLWAKIVGLYLQVRPDIARILYDKLFEMRDKDDKPLLLLLNES